MSGTIVRIFTMASLRVIRLILEVSGKGQGSRDDLPKISYHIPKIPENYPKILRS